MTIKKIGLSAIAAMTMVTSASAITLGSGSLAKEDGTKVSIGSELLAVESVEANITTRLIYTSDIEASSATEPGFEITFAGLNTASNLRISDLDTNDTIASFERVDGNTVIFSTATGKTIERNKQYAITTKDINTSIGQGELSINLPAGGSNFDATLTLWNNNGDQKLDVAAVTLFETKQQFTATIPTALSAEIDAANSLKTFDTTATAANATSTTTDTVAVKFTDNFATIDFPATLTAYTMDIQPSDGNLSAYVISASAISTTDGNGTLAMLSNGFKVSAAVDRNSTYTPSIVLSTTQATGMEAATFSGSAVATFSGTTSHTLAATTATAGEWTIYGYNGQIPNVVSNSTKETYINITNTSTRDAVPVFTILPTVVHSSGTTTGSGISECTVSGTSIASNTSVKYTMQGLLALSGAENCNDSAITNFAVEVTVPTEPDKVYANAQQRKGDVVTVLPVYNTSTYSY